MIDARDVIGVDPLTANGEVGMQLSLGFIVFFKGSLQFDPRCLRINVLGHVAVVGALSAPMGALAHHPAAFVDGVAVVMCTRCFLTIPLFVACARCRLHVVVEHVLSLAVFSLAPRNPGEFREIWLKFLSV